jgi:lipopolysaccharide transport system ATP-binding protein
MSRAVISVEDLSKCYHLGQIGTGTLTNDLKVWWARARGKPNPLLKIGQSDKSGQNGEIIWALNKINFQVNQGDVLGIIGRNGAGKSTLLKILSRVTAPTSGLVKVKGRIASLLEVGTGFHPELTGRENIFLNGAILGMTKAEIQKKLDDIVAFAEIEKFIDTPVKRYSSGMYVRLAFAVAAHLESDILLVDEVLAVGDAEFQKKCLGKMGDVATKEGRTVLFVSHNMGAVSQLCLDSLLFQKGHLVEIGPTPEVITKYLKIFSSIDYSPFDLQNPERSGNRKIILTGGRIIDHQGNITTSVIAGNRITMEFDYENTDGLDFANISLTIFNGTGTPITNTATSLTIGDIGGLKNKGTFKCIFERIPFQLGEYRVAIAIHNSGMVTDLIPNALSFSVDSSIFFPSFKTPKTGFSMVMVDHRWEHNG